jgi:serine/tyrosine/threonine adenylyltransferase
MTAHFPFDNSYARLPDRFYTRQAPVPVEAPALIAVNEALAARLGLTLPEDPVETAAIFAGNRLPEGAEPLAQVYAGHQFGGWVPQLGDGRAILLGEVVAPDGARFDIQLKGAGRTPYSRMGDGRAWLGPVIREYVVSEAMAALGIPTTRALAAVTTGEIVLREGRMPGAVFARVAASHIRVGTFQFFAARRDVDALRALAGHAIARHYPEVEGPAGLLDAVIGAQAALVARWMGVGFIHGVMNTDNMAVSGETIDYGPCAFMDEYHPETVFSSIDQYGRYAYANQPQIAVWNLAQLATALLPLMPDRDAAIEEFTAAVNGFADRFDAEWHAVLRDEARPRRGAGGGRGACARPPRADGGGQRGLHQLLPRALGRGARDGGCAVQRSGDADAVARSLARAAHRRGTGGDGAHRRDGGREPSVDPAQSPRGGGDRGRRGRVIFAPFQRLNRALARPFDPAPGDMDLAAKPRTEERVLRTFCGT